MMIAFKKTGWFRNKKILLYLEGTNDCVFYELDKIKKYYGAANLDYRQMERLRDLLSKEMLIMENSTDDNQ